MQFVSKAVTLICNVSISLVLLNCMFQMVFQAGLLTKAPRLSWFQRQPRHSKSRMYMLGFTKETFREFTLPGKSLKVSSIELAAWCRLRSISTNSKTKKLIIAHLHHGYFSWLLSRVNALVCFEMTVEYNSFRTLSSVFSLCCVLVVFWLWDLFIWRVPDDVSWVLELPLDQRWPQVTKYKSKSSLKSIYTKNI